MTFFRRQESLERWKIFSICGLGFILSMFYRVSFAIMSPSLGLDLDLSPGELGTLSAAFFYAFALSHIPLGLALDRIGPRRVMTLLSGLGVTGAILFAFAGSGGQALWGRVLMGIGMSCSLMGAFTLLAAWFPPERFATMTGAMISIGAIGQMVAATPLAVFSGWIGWRGAFMVVAFFHALHTVVFFLVVRDRPRGCIPDKRTGSSLSGPGWLLSLPAFWVISFGVFFRYGCFMALMGFWAGPFLIYGLDLHLIQVGNSIFSMSLGFMVGLPISGRISDRVIRSRKYVAMPSFFILALLIIALGLWQKEFPVQLTYTLFFAIGLAVAPGQVVYAHIKELVPPHLSATAMTGINVFTGLGSAVLMQVAKILLPSESANTIKLQEFLPVWWFMAGGLVVAGMVYTLIPDSKALKNSTLIYPEVR